MPSLPVPTYALPSGMTSKLLAEGTPGRSVRRVVTPAVITPPESMLVPSSLPSPSTLALSSTNERVGLACARAASNISSPAEIHRREGRK